MQGQKLDIAVVQIWGHYRKQIEAWQEGNKLEIAVVQTWGHYRKYVEVCQDGGKYSNKKQETK